MEVVTKREICSLAGLSMRSQADKDLEQAVLCAVSDAYDGISFVRAMISAVNVATNVRHVDFVGARDRH